MIVFWKGLIKLHLIGSDNSLLWRSQISRILLR